MAVPYTFGSATTSIPLSQLDSNFATTITLGNTAIQLGNTVTTLNNMTLANVTITSGTSSFSSIANGTSNVTIASSGGAIAMATNGTTAITVDTSQRVGIGTVGTIPSWGSSPTGVLQVGGSTLSAYSGEIELSLNAYYAGGWKYNANGYASQYLQNTGVHQWFTAANNTSGAGASISDFSSPKMTLNINGALALFGASTSANGAGITFPATQSASSDANTLDDYEEGDWTPTYTATSGSFGAITYRFQSGKYTKIGRAVSFTCLIATDSITLSTATGSVNISGLPFTNNAAENAYAVSAANTFGANYPSGANTASSQTTIRLLYRTAANGTTANFPVTSLDTTIAYGNLVQIGGTYFV